MVVPADSGDKENRRIIIGRINGIYGVRGWLKIYSYTRPKENIFSFSEWFIEQDGEWQSCSPGEFRQQGNTLVASIEGTDDRDLARALIGKDIAVYRSQLPDLPDGEYYWCDLLDLDVFDKDGRLLGQVVEIQETGANDVLIVQGDSRYLIPLVYDKIVQQVDMEKGSIQVDWNPEYI